MSDKTTVRNCRNSRVGVPTPCGIVEKGCSIHWGLFTVAHVHPKKYIQALYIVYFVQEREFLA